jgi:hypothetical protein
MVSVEALESRFAPWVGYLVAASIIVGAITLLMGLFEGTVGLALFAGVATLALAIGSLVTSRVIHTRQAAAIVAVALALVAFGAGLQSAILGTGTQ